MGLTLLTKPLLIFLLWFQHLFSVYVLLAFHCRKHERRKPPRETEREQVWRANWKPVEGGSETHRDLSGRASPAPSARSPAPIAYPRSQGQRLPLSVLLAVPTLWSTSGLFRFDRFDHFDPAGLATAEPVETARAEGQRLSWQTQQPRSRAESNFSPSLCTGFGPSASHAPKSHQELYLMPPFSFPQTFPHRHHNAWWLSYPQTQRTGPLRVRCLFSKHCPSHTFRSQAPWVENLFSSAPESTLRHRSLPSGITNWTDLHQHLIRPKQKPLKTWKGQILSEAWGSICPRHLRTQQRKTFVPTLNLLLPRCFTFFPHLPTTPRLPCPFPKNNWTAQSAG